MAGSTFLQAKMKLGAFPVSHSWLLGILHKRCAVGSGFLGEELGNLSGRAIVAVKTIKKEKKQHSAGTPFGHIVCAQCALSHLMFWYYIDEICFQSWKVSINIFIHPYIEIRSGRITRIPFISPVALSNFAY